MIVSAQALLYALWILGDLLRREQGSPEMQKIARYILEGAEGFFVAQYGTIFKLSFVFCIGIIVLYYTRPLPPPLQAISISGTVIAFFSGFCFLYGAVCSAFSGYAGMWVSVRANVRVAAAARRCYNDAINIAFRGGYFAAVINIALAVFGVSSAFALLYLYLARHARSEALLLEYV